MTAAGSLTFSPSEQNQRYQLRIELADRDGRLVAHYEQVLNPQADEDSSDLTIRVPFVQALEELVVPRSGPYAIRIVVDGTLLVALAVHAEQTVAA
jgi:hypothetical protein